MMESEYGCQHFMQASFYFRDAEILITFNFLLKTAFFSIILACNFIHMSGTIVIVKMDST